MLNNRNDKFFSENEFELLLSFYEEQMSQINTTVTIYKIDAEKSVSDDLYNSLYSNEIRIKEKKEFLAYIRLGDSENKTITNNGKLRYEDYGLMECDILHKHIEQSKLDIKYGDYLAIQINPTLKMIYQIVDNNAKFIQRDNLLGGRNPVFRRIKATPTDLQPELFV